MSEAPVPPAPPPSPQPVEAKSDVDKPQSNPFDGRRGLKELNASRVRPITYHSMIPALVHKREQLEHPQIAHIVNSHGVTCFHCDDTDFDHFLGLSKASRLPDPVEPSFDPAIQGPMPWEYHFPFTSEARDAEYIFWPYRFPYPPSVDDDGREVVKDPDWDVSWVGIVIRLEELRFQLGTAHHTKYSHLATYIAVIDTVEHHREERHRMIESRLPRLLEDARIEAEDKAWAGYENEPLIVLQRLLPKGMESRSGHTCYVVLREMFHRLHSILSEGKWGNGQDAKYTWDRFTRPWEPHASIHQLLVRACEREAAKIQGDNDQPAVREQGGQEPAQIVTANQASAASPAPAPPPPVPPASEPPAPTPPAPVQPAPEPPAQEVPALEIPAPIPRAPATPAIPPQEPESQRPTEAEQHVLPEEQQTGRKRKADDEDAGHAGDAGDAGNAGDAGEDGDIGDDEDDGDDAPQPPAPPPAVRRSTRSSVPPERLGNPQAPSGRPSKKRKMATKSTKVKVEEEDEDEGGDGDDPAPPAPPAGRGRGGARGRGRGGETGRGRGRGRGRGGGRGGETGRGRGRGGTATRGRGGGAAPKTAPAARSKTPAHKGKQSKKPPAQGGAGDTEAEAEAKKTSQAEARDQRAEKRKTGFPYGFPERKGSQKTKPDEEPKA